MESKQIPDLWQAVLEGNRWQVQTAAGDVVARIEKTIDEEVNASLIAASPYMLEALKAMAALIGDEDLPDNGELSGAAICDMVRAAVDLATDAG